jgi:hypothetical protein
MGNTKLILVEKIKRDYRGKDRRIMTKDTGMRMWTGFMWIWIRTSGGLLRTQN